MLSRAVPPLSRADRRLVRKEATRARLLVMRATLLDTRDHNCGRGANRGGGGRRDESSKQC